MKDQILKLIKDRPKHYNHDIKKIPELMQWIDNNTLAVNTDHLPTRIYSAIYNESNICKYGNQIKVKRFSNGFTKCGAAAVCKCTKESIATSVTTSKALISKEDKDKTNKKRHDYMIEKYGVPYNSQRPDVKEVLQKPKVTNEVYNKLSDYIWMKNEYIDKGRSGVDIARELNVYYGTVLEYCKQHGFDIRRYYNYSLVEVEIADFIKSLNIKNIKQNDWTVLQTKELDITILDHNLAIEVNGLYWHSYNPNRFEFENKTRHLDKTIECEKLGIDLIHVTDWEWNNKQDIIKSIITNKLGLNQKVYARKTSIVELTSKEARVFFEQNHLQGFVGSKYYIGLEYNSELIMAITAGKNRFAKNSTDLELHRMASTSGFSVVGGFNKLLKYLKNKSNYKSLISYCDKSKFNGNGYKVVGFELIKTIGPGYFWTNGTDNISRYTAMKSKLPLLLVDKFDPNKTEAENMFDNRYSRYWDCGNMLFELKE